MGAQKAETQQKELAKCARWVATDHWLPSTPLNMHVRHVKKNKETKKQTEPPKISFKNAITY